MSVKKKVFSVIQPAGDGDKISRAFDLCIIALIVINVILVIADTFKLPLTVSSVSSVIENISIVIFTIEYILRLWTSDLLYTRLWNYVKVRTAKNRTCYKYVNGQRIKYVVEQPLGGHARNNSKIVYSLDFKVTPHQLRHTYITNLLYAGVDPKTVQYLAGHENSKTTMDIYAKIKYNKPEELLGVVNAAFGQQTAM